MFGTFFYVTIRKVINVIFFSRDTKSILKPVTDWKDKFWPKLKSPSQFHESASKDPTNYCYTKSCTYCSDLSNSLPKLASTSNN